MGLAVGFLGNRVSAPSEARRIFNEARVKTSEPNNVSSVVDVGHQEPFRGIHHKYSHLPKG